MKDVQDEIEGTLSWNTSIITTPPETLPASPEGDGAGDVSTARPSASISNYPYVEDEEGSAQDRNGRGQGQEREAEKEVCYARRKLG